MNRRRRLSAGEQGVTDRQHRVAFASVAAVLLGDHRRAGSTRPRSRFRHEARPQRSKGTTIRTASATAPEPQESGGPRNTVPVIRAVAIAELGATSYDARARAEEGAAVPPREARAATAAARASFDGYLPYSYGQSDAGPIRAAAWRLLRELEASPPRVPAAVARARPRLISVRAEAATGDLDVDVLAAVDDGQRRYSIRLLVRKAERRWIVAAVSG